MTPFRRLAQQYPFDQAGIDAAPADVAAYFHPERGALWQFYRRELQRDLPEAGEAFIVDTRLDGAMLHAYAPSLRPFLTQAKALSRVLFAGPDEQSVGLSFDARLLLPPSASKLALEIDGQVIEAAERGAAPRWQRIQWPGPKHGGPLPGAVLTQTGKDGLRDAIRFEGAWGFLRLLEAGKQQGKPSEGIVRFHWPLAAHAGDAVVEVRLLSAETMLFARGSSRLLGPFRQRSLAPPRIIAPGGEPCR